MGDSVTIAAGKRFREDVCSSRNRTGFARQERRVIRLARSASRGAHNAPARKDGMGMTDKTPQRIAIADLQKKMKSSRKPLVVDVREPKELAEGAIPGALHIPMAKLE